MKTISFQKSGLLRKERNLSLVKKMRNGESLNSFNSVDSWFPPRPIIEKDGEAIQRLYGKGATAAGHEDEPEFKPLKLAQ